MMVYGMLSYALNNDRSGYGTVGAQDAANSGNGAAMQDIEV